MVLSVNLKMFQNLSETWNNVTANPLSNVTHQRLENSSHVLTTSSMTSPCKEELTTKDPTPESSHDAFLYIVVVLLFYAFSMVILMVKYIRRERQEAEMAHYYSEFVSRDRFKAPIFEIKRCMNKIMASSGTKLDKRAESSEEFMSCLDVSVFAESTTQDNFKSEKRLIF